MSHPDCTYICEMIHGRLLALGFGIDPSEEDHTDIILALNQTSLVHDRDLNKAKAIEKAYCELWAAVENGKIDEKFFDLRSKFRELMQVSHDPAQKKVVSDGEHLPIIELKESPDIIIVIEGGIITNLATSTHNLTYRIIDIDAAETGDDDDRIVRDYTPDITGIDAEEYTKAILKDAKLLDICLADQEKEAV